MHSDHDKDTSTSPGQHVHRVVGTFKTGYSGDPQRPFFFEVTNEGGETVRYLLQADQAYDLDMGLFLLRPIVSGRGCDGIPIK